MEINILNLDKLDSSLRLDSDFYKKEYIANDNKLKKKEFFILGDNKVFPLVTDGDHGNPIYSDEGTPYLKSKDISHFDLNLESVEKIENKYSEKMNKRCFTKKNEILLSTVGTIGISYLIKDKGQEFVLSRDIAKIKTNEKSIIPEYLYLFLKTKYGKLQIERYSTGSVQKGLYLGAIKQIKVPNLELNKQKETIEDVKKIYDLIKESKESFEIADKLILEYLDLKNLNLKSELFKIKDTSSFDETLRFDSEYYQEKFKILKKKLNEFENFPLEERAIVTDGDHGSPEYLEKGILFLRALNVRKYFLDYKDIKFVSKEYHEKFLKRSILKKNDIIVTKIGTIGVTAIIPNIEANTTASCGKIRIRKEYSKDINPYYLSCFLNNLPGKLLMEMNTTGSVQTGIILKTLRKIIIPKIKYENQLEIEKLIKQGINKKEEADELIKNSIKKIENWIEN